MANTASNVVVGKPRATGGVYAGATTATLPTGPSAALDASLSALGYLDDTGVTMTKGGDTTPIRAWGGDEIRVIKTSDSLAFKFAFLETSAATLGEVFGTDNVTTPALNVTKVAINSAQLDNRAYVFEVLDGDTAYRIVVPNAQITEHDDVPFTDGDPVNYGVTLSAFPDASGNKAYIYFTKFYS